MAAPYTQLSPTATSGRRYSFAPKTAAGAVKGAGPFTELQVTALPGPRHAFLPKTPSVPPVKGVGPFTELSVLGTPGKRHSFLAKTAAEVISTPSWRHAGDWDSIALHEDEELMAILQAIIQSGMLN